MRRALVILTAVAVLVAVVPASARLFASPSTEQAVRSAGQVRIPPAARAGEMVLYGHIKSLARRGGRFEMRFDPAWWLNGLAAERAAVEDKLIQPEEPVPNDYYVVEEGHRLLTLPVSATARVTVLSKRIRPLVIAVSELAQIVNGKNPKNRPLFDRDNSLGFWIRIDYRYPSPVLSLDQQYQP